MGNTGKPFYGKRSPKQHSCEGERGNAVIYVLIVVALFAALSFVLSRQSDTSEQGALGAEKLEVQVAQIIQVSNQIKQGIDQLQWSGTDISDMDFVLPSAGAFETPPNIHKVFHPEGGGLIMPRIPADAVQQINTNPASGWYLGRFNNVEWTQSTEQDVIFVAHQIKQPVCAAINEKLTGSSTIPALTSDINKALIDATFHTNGPNVDLDTTICPDCDGLPTLCVENAAGTIWSYYNIIAQQ